VFVVVMKTANGVFELKQGNETVYFETFAIAKAEADRLARLLSPAARFWVEAA
jgi:hypothetical protein